MDGIKCVQDLVLSENHGWDGEVLAIAFPLSAREHVILIKGG